MLHVGVVLAGGRSTRMGGGHKFLREIAGVTLLDRVIERLRPQVDLLVVSTAGNSSPLDSGLTIVTDVFADAGPLAGIHAAAAWAKRAVGADARIVTVPADTPFYSTGPGRPPAGCRVQRSCCDCRCRLGLRNTPCRRILAGRCGGRPRSVARRPGQPIHPKLLLHPRYRDHSFQ